MSTMTLKQTPVIHPWLAVFILSIAAFIFNTTEFIPVGLLTDIAHSFHMRVANTGLIMTIYAWTVTLLSVPFAMLFARFERRKLLCSIFLLFIASHLLAAFAWNFTSLLIARLGIAAAHAVFWSITIPMAVRLAPEGQSAKALSLIITGTSLATVLGVPLGTVIGHQLGWRSTFGLIAIAASAVLILLMLVLPKLPSKIPSNFNILPSLIKRPALRYVYITLALSVGAYFTAYTYISPFLQRVGGMDNRAIVANLFCIGIAGILAGIIFAKNSNRYPTALLIMPMVVMLLCLLCLQLASYHVTTMLLLSLLWGVAMTTLAMALQNKVLEVAHDAPDIAMAMFSGVYNIGIGGGALLGGQIILHSSFSLLGYIGSILVLFSILLFLFYGKKLWIKTNAA